MAGGWTAGRKAQLLRELGRAGSPVNLLTQLLYGGEGIAFLAAIKSDRNFYHRVSSSLREEGAAGHELAQQLGRSTPRGPGLVRMQARTGPADMEHPEVVRAVHGSPRESGVKPAGSLPVRQLTAGQKSLILSELRRGRGAEVTRMLLEGVDRSAFLQALEADQAFRSQVVDHLQKAGLADLATKVNRAGGPLRRGPALEEELEKAARLAEHGIKATPARQFAQEKWKRGKRRDDGKTGLEDVIGDSRLPHWWRRQQDHDRKQEWLARTRAMRANKVPEHMIPGFKGDPARKYAGAKLSELPAHYLEKLYTNKQLFRNLPYEVQKDLQKYIKQPGTQARLRNAARDPDDPQAGRWREVEAFDPRSKQGYSFRKGVPGSFAPSDASLSELGAGGVAAGRLDPPGFQAAFREHWLSQEQTHSKIASPVPYLGSEHTRLIYDVDAQLNWRGSRRGSDYASEWDPWARREQEENQLRRQAYRWAAGAGVPGWQRKTVADRMVDWHRWKIAEDEVDILQEQGRQWQAPRSQTPDEESAVAWRAARLRTRSGMLSFEEAERAMAGSASDELFGRQAAHQEYQGDPADSARGWMVGRQEAELTQRPVSGKPSQMKDFLVQIEMAQSVDDMWRVENELDLWRPMWRDNPTIREAFQLRRSALAFTGGQ